MLHHISMAYHITMPHNIQHCLSERWYRTGIPMINHGHTTVASQTHSMSNHTAPAYQTVLSYAFNNSWCHSTSAIQRNTHRSISYCIRTLASWQHEMDLFRGCELATRDAGLCGIRRKTRQTQISTCASNGHQGFLHEAREVQ